MESSARHRLLMSLRSERAMGLDSILAAATGVAGGEDRDVQGELPVEELLPMMRSVPKPVVAQSGGSTAPRVPISLPTANPFTAPLLTSEEKRARLLAMDSKEVRCCVKCRLSETRTKTVFGEGDPDAKIFFIGEGPGENEDLTGRPFVGRAGQLLDKMIGAMGLKREQVFIANIVKCRPPNNRVPAPDEVATCTPYLERQLEIVRPRVIVTLGRPSTAYMLNDPKLTMGRSRGRWHEWRGIKLMPTFHPSYVLRMYTPETRKAVWSDLQQVMKEVGIDVSNQNNAPA